MAIAAKEIVTTMLAVGDRSGIGGSGGVTVVMVIPRRW